MLSRVEVWGYKCLADIDVSTSGLNVVVGPNASGKSTFLDVPVLLSDALRLDGDMDRAVRKRARQLEELVWGQLQGFIDLALELRAPESLFPASAGRAGWGSLRYEVRIGTGDDGALQVCAERAFGIEAGASRWERAAEQFELAGTLRRRPILDQSPPETGCHRFLRRGPDGVTEFRARGESKWPYRPPGHRLALAGVPEDWERFAPGLWLREALRDRIQVLQLNSLAMRRPCPPDVQRDLAPDGSNIALVCRELRRQAPERFDWWVEHVSSVLVGLAGIDVREQPHDRHLYLTVRYEYGVEVPSWLLSDGTMRLLAMTLIAYLPSQGRIYIIEEPENGIHPRAVEAVMQSLGSVYEGQVLMATHSPVVVGLAEPEQLLCFSQGPDGATEVVAGARHPALAQWRREVPLADLFAGGVLG